MKNKLKSYSIYVIRLNDAVLKEKKFKDANPNYIKGKPCSYVGCTKHTIEKRVKEHRSGHTTWTKWHNTFVKKYYKHMQPKQYESINPILSLDHKEQRVLEAQLADKLRKKGWGIWQN